MKQRDEALAESGELQRFVIDLDNFQIWLVNIAVKSRKKVMFFTATGLLKK